MRKVWAKYACDVCGKEIEVGDNIHLDPAFAGWVQYTIHRFFDSAVIDASKGGCDGRGELCPDCFAGTRIRLLPSESERRKARAS